MKMLRNFFLFAIIGWFNLCVLFAEKPVIYVSGSSTVANMIMTPYKGEIEKKANINLEILVKGSEYGLMDLALGRCDIAMISGPLASIAEKVNEYGPNLVRLDQYTEFKLGETSVVFIVNKKNPIDYLQSKELKLICIGDVLNWKELGGSDSRIILFTMEPGVGVRTIVQDILLKGDFWGVYTTVLRSSQAMNYMVQHLPEAIGTINIDEVGDSVKVLKTDVVLTQPLILVTKSNPSAELLAVVNAIKSVASEKLSKVDKKLEK